MNSSNPFAHDRYDLPNCRLERFDPRHAEETAQRLVAMDPWKTYGSHEESFVKELIEDDPSLFRFSVQAGPDRAGIVTVRFPWLLGPYLELFAIWPEHQGRGFGREILAWLEKPAETPMRNVWICVSAFNESARRFYKRNGYNESATLSGLVRIGIDEILLRKAIT